MEFSIFKGLAPEPRADAYTATYDSLASAVLAEPGEWIGVPFGKLPGRTRRDKQSAAHQAMLVRGIRVSTFTEPFQRMVGVRYKNAVNPVNPLSDAICEE